ncbi:septum formation protein [Halobacillus alkaliphilus]|uniref:dTTP/UTP pyrophosphatase n=1 Tax=Halobacillus alkaliphilus TaxID=396056 RepID=A0A1I2JGP5_9BACI|nr:Maf family protein [Halobacillus alkaliphilus]SFF52337.1 septum formation protein [Halobacillus alkaliphilus]
MPTLILGSQSPRRKGLLKEAGYEFLLRVSGTDEELEKGVPPEQAVSYLSKQKSLAIPIEENEVLLTADTLVSIDGEILGKPADESEAFSFLTKLSGRTHQVHTGVTLRSKEHIHTFVVKTDVTFFSLSDKEIYKYMESGEAWDKAGGYGIQGKGALFVKYIHGDYYSVVGLPIAKVVRELEAFGVLLG